MSWFLQRLLDIFICPDCHGFFVEPDYPDLRDIMSGTPLKTSTQRWVDSLTMVLGNTETNRPRDVTDTHLSSIEHLRQDIHELIVIEMQYQAMPRWYSLERLVGEEPTSAPASFQLHLQRMKGKPVNRPPGTHKVQDMVNRFANLYEARMHPVGAGIIKSFKVPATVNLNVLQVAVLAKLVSKHCPTDDRFETTSWLWARTYFACLQYLCERGSPGSLKITYGPAAGIVGQRLPKDTDSFVHSIASRFLKFFKYDLEEGDVGSNEDELAHAVLDDFEPAYQAAFAHLKKNADTITITREEFEELLCLEEKEKAKRVVKRGDSSNFDGETTGSGSKAPRKVEAYGCSATPRKLGS